MAAKLYIQLIYHMANTRKTGLDGYQVMQLNYANSNEHTRIETNFHLWNIYKRPFPFIQGTFPTIQVFMKHIHWQT